MKNPLSTITESLKQGAEVLKKKIDDTAKNFKQKFEQAVDKITTSMEWAKKEFETAVKKITTALTWARDELQKAGADLKKSLTELSVVASLNKAGDKLVEAIQGIANRVRQAGKDIKSSGKGGDAAPAAGKIDEKSSKTTAPMKNTKKDSPSAGVKKSDTITVSATPKSKSGYQINKGTNKNVSVDTTYKPKTKPKTQSKPKSQSKLNRPKRRKEEQQNNNKTQKTRRRGGRKGKASSRGKGEGLNGMDFNKVADTITQIQGHVSGMITSLDKAIETGDMTPVVQELAKIPGAIGQVAKVAMQSYKIGNQAYDFYMKNMGGEERLIKDTVDSTTAVSDHSYQDKNYVMAKRQVTQYRDFLDELVANKQISEEESKKRLIAYFAELKNGRRDTYQKTRNQVYAMREDKDNAKRLGSKKLKEMENKEGQYNEWRKNSEKQIQDAVISGKVKKDSYEYFKMVQDMEDETLKKLIKLKNEFKSLGMKTKTKQMEEAIRNTKSTREKLSGNAHAAIENQSYAQMGTKEGQTIQDKIKNLEQKREQHLRDANNTDITTKRGKESQNALFEQAQIEKGKIDELKVELAKQEKAKTEQTKVATSSGAMQGDQCYDKLEEIRKLLEKSVADGKSGQPAQAKAQDVGESGKKKELASSDDSMGFGGDVAETAGDNKKFQSTLPVKVSQAEPADTSGQEEEAIKAKMVATKSKPESKMDRMDAENAAAARSGLRGFPSGGSPVGGEENKMDRMDAENAAAARSSLRGFPSKGKLGRGRKSGRKIAGKYGFRDIPAFNSGPALAKALEDEKAMPALKAAEISDKTKLGMSMGTNESNQQASNAQIMQIIKHIDEVINRRLPGDNF